MRNTENLTQHAQIAGVQILIQWLPYTQLFQATALLPHGASTRGPVNVGRAITIEGALQELFDGTPEYIGAVKK